MTNSNLLLQADSYKVGHAKSYPPKLSYLYSYLESRGGEFPATVFFGLQYYLREYLARGFTRRDISEAATFWNAHFGRNDVFDSAEWDYLLECHQGKLPLKIMAVPEGALVPVNNVLMTIENSDPQFPWLTNFVETLLLKVWYPTTVATQSYFIRQAIKREFELTGADLAGLDFACHDFGYRGVSSEETAGLGGAAHLLSFLGTDTVAGILMLEETYGGGMSGFSIPATEHSVITAFGRHNEVEAFAHFLKTFPTGTIACVSDTYDIYNAVEHLWGGVFRDEILNRDGRLVIRPDSGNPFMVVPELLEIMGDKFGYTVNQKGYRVLDPHVRLIQGDGMNRETIPQLYARIRKLGWSAENLVVGSGGALLQAVNRDTCKFAIKASHALVDRQPLDIAKTPVTDSGKRSKRGRLKLVFNEQNTFETVSSAEERERWADSIDQLAPVFVDGECVTGYSIGNIRARLRSFEGA